MNLPIPLGYMILQYAKLHMLKFYYDFFMENVDKKDFEFVEMDTDSAYYGLSGLHDVILPTEIQEFENDLNKQCNNNDNRTDTGRSVWFSRECCGKHKAFDNRTLGLMKLEFQGDEIIGLCSKSYIAVNTQTGKIKYTIDLKLGENSCKH